MGRELQTLNGQNKLALWAGRISECRNSGQNVKTWCRVQIVTVTGQQGRNFGPVRAIMPGQVRTRFPASYRTFAYNEITSLQKRNSLQEVQTWTTNECSPCILPTG